MLVVVQKDSYINTNNISYISGSRVRMVCGDEIDITDEELKEIILSFSKRSNIKNTDPEDKLVSLFEELHKLTGGKSKPTLTLERERKLKDLLGKHRLTEELLRTAARNIGLDKFLQGENDRNVRYGTIDYLLRPEKAVMWAEKESKKKKAMF